MSAPLPRNVVCVLLDSLSRNLLGCYGGHEFETPNLDRFATRASQFHRHFVGSLPCMPARHDLACGTHDFLWKPWGSIESWEVPLPRELSAAGVTTQLVTDHYHLFSSGGENYHVDFLGWDFLRGGEADRWITEPVPSQVGAPILPYRDFSYPRNRQRFETEADWHGPRTMATAAAWLDDNAGKHERFFLLVDEFDPHEPFDTPAPYRDMYDPSWADDPIIWPPYSREHLDEAVARQIRSQYGGKLTMIDAWFGRVLDALDRHALWDDTLVVVMTDHGLYLGEHDMWGKPSYSLKSPLVRVPLLVHAPGAARRDVDSLTSNLDVHATIRAVFGFPEGDRPGRSLLPVLHGEQAGVREWALGGYFGHRPFVTDGRMAYQPGASTDSPVYVYSNRWSAPPFLPLPAMSRDAELGEFMPGVEWPVIRTPLSAWRTPIDVAETFLFDLDDDPGEQQNRADDAKEVSAAHDLLVAALDEVSAPPEVYERVAIGQ
ncbi:MAG TPA: sulfatase [Acidimicrobiales bacterium]|nr:sulfatase [Acidimicrobiales bacterium]